LKQIYQEMSDQVETSTGESIPGPIVRIGNTNSRLRFGLPPAEFIDRWCMNGPTHHCALGVGHQNRMLSKVACLLDLPIVSVG
jgi:L-arabinose isomerase